MMRQKMVCRDQLLLDDSSEKRVNIIYSQRNDDARSMTHQCNGTTVETT